MLFFFGSLSLSHRVFLVFERERNANEKQKDGKRNNFYLVSALVEEKEREDEEKDRGFRYTHSSDNNKVEE